VDRSLESEIRGDLGAKRLHLRVADAPARCPALEEMPAVVFTRIFATAKRRITSRSESTSTVSEGTSKR